MTTPPLTALAIAIAMVPAVTLAHDLERTRVAIEIASDGSFQIDVANDPSWLLLRLESFAGGAIPPKMSVADRDRRLAALTSTFVDRIVLFVDRHEVRPESAQYLPPTSSADPPLSVFRLRGRLPAQSRTMRWFYGLVIDPYPLTIAAADGTSRTHIVLGEGWSESIPLPQTVSQRTRVVEIAGLLCAAVVLLAVRAKRRQTA